MPGLRCGAQALAHLIGRGRAYARGVARAETSNGGFQPVDQVAGRRAVAQQDVAAGQLQAFGQRAYP